VTEPAPGLPAQLVLGEVFEEVPPGGRLLTLLIPAVGGQGGGVLAEWIVEAAQLDGLVAHGTSIPGVAQRTGSTTYYVEVFTGPAGEPPAFSLYPVPGALDVLLAPEFLEVGRAIELGFPSPARTTSGSCGSGCSRAAGGCVPSPTAGGASTSGCSAGSMR
jgi:hypothetical protein